MFEIYVFTNDNFNNTNNKSSRNYEIIFNVNNKNNIKKNIFSDEEKVDKSAYGKPNYSSTDKKNIIINPRQRSYASSRVAIEIISVIG